MSKAIIWPVAVGYSVVDSETLKPLVSDSMEKREAMKVAFEFNIGKRAQPVAKMEPVEIEVKDPAPKPKRRTRKKAK